jgi:hypothetical protein
MAKGKPTVGPGGRPFAGIGDPIGKKKTEKGSRKTYGPGQSQKSDPPEEKNVPPEVEGRQE